MLRAIRADIERYNAGRGHPVAAVIKAIYSHLGFLGVLWYRLGHALWLRKRNPLCYFLLLGQRALYPLIRLYSGLELAPRTEIGEGLYVGHHGPTIIHPDTIAGRNLTLVHAVTIGSHKGAVPRIGNDVDVATGAILIGGITVGDRAVIGAGAVVTHDVAAGSIVAGVPAREIGSRLGESDCS